MSFGSIKQASILNQVLEGKGGLRSDLIGKYSTFQKSKTIYIDSMQGGQCNPQEPPWGLNFCAKAVSDQLPQL